PPDAPMEVFIGSHTHSGGLDADPFARVPFQPAQPPVGEQFAEDVSFLQRVLAGQPIGHSVRYYVLGSGAWKTTRVWPPEGVKTRELHFTRTGLEVQPSYARGERRYQVDPMTSSGSFTRWAAQTGAPVYYEDRRFSP